jgi:alginate O-acetyltransferase complex protein AlgI
LVNTFRNVVVTMFLAGLWHGAAWHFVVWGLLHGAFLVLERGAQILRLWPHEASALPGKLAAAAVTFVCVLAWTFFRATSFDQAMLLIQQMLNAFDAARGLERIDRVTALAVMAALVATHAALRTVTLEGAIAAAGYGAPVSLALMLIAIVSAGGEARGFIYFQF